MRLLIGILTTVLMSACASGPETASQKTQSGLEIQSYKDKVFFSGQLQKQNFQEVADLGIKTIINLRSKKELSHLGFDEGEEAKKAGLIYYNIPIKTSGEFDPQAVQKIEETFMKHHKSEKVLIHCGSGTRAKAWFAIHVAETHKSDAESGLKKARELGLKSQVWEQKVKNYLGN